MLKFDFFNVPQIVFGCGQIKRLPELAAPLGQSALIVFNGPRPLAQKIAELLDQAKIRATLVRQEGEPKVTDIDSALDAARIQSCDMVIGLGGGSAIDAAKAVAALLTNGGSALDYMEVVGKGQKISKQAAPWIAIPTTAGTGAEVTRNAVIGAPEQKFKASIRGPQLLARIALVDPELGVSTPPKTTAASGMDALCQCIESYTSTGAQPMTDALALEGIRCAARSLRRAFDDGTDVAARQDMAMCALLSGITLTNAGLGAVHGFAAPLGANFPAPHGVICAALLPAVIKMNVEALRAQSPEHPVLRRYADVGRILNGRADADDETAILEAEAQCTALFRGMKIPPLRHFGIGATNIDSMITLAKKASSMRYNPVELSDLALNQIMLDAI